MVLGDGEISQSFGSVRLVGGESLVSQRIVFSRDSKLLFCSCGRRIRVYSTATGDLVRELKGHETNVTDFKINPRNHLQLVSCALRGEVIYWDYTDGRILKKYTFGGSLGGILLHSAHNDSIILIRKIPRPDDTKNKKGDKKVKNTKKKVEDIEDFCVGVFNPKDWNKDSKPKLNVFLRKSGSSKQTTINGEGNLLASVNGQNLYLWNFTSERFNMFKYNHATFTCASFHPSEACVAAGDKEGQIILWQGLDQVENPITMVLHWHPHPVGDIIFSNDGSMILSGGEEGVLVQWQYKTHHQQFLPRLGAPIHHISVSPDDSLTAICQKDNIIRLISNVENVVKRNIQGLRLIHNLYMGISFDPHSKALVTGIMPGVLQFYHPQTDHHIFSLDVVKQNYVPPRPGDAQLVYTRIDHVAFNGDGSWLATVERRDDKKHALEMRLKFWEYDKLTQSYIPNTCVDPPHDKKIVALQFQTQQKKDSNLGPLAMTAGRDGKFKIWILSEEKVIKGEKHCWSCRSVGYYGDMPCQDAAFSQDGSLLAVAYEQTITLWTPEANELRKTLSLPYPDEEVKTIKFGTNSSSQYLISVTNRYLTVWNLLSCSVWWSLEAPVSCLVTDPQTHLFCAFVAFHKNKSHLYIFDPASPRPVAVQPCVSKKTDILCAAFDPASSLCSSTQDENIKMSKLYFLTQKQELFTLDCEETTSDEGNATSQVPLAGSSEQDSEFLKIFGQPLPSKGESSSLNRSGKRVKGTPSRAVVKQLLQTPSHVLPSVTSLCLSFLQSFLVSKHSLQREEDSDDEDDASESEDEEMEVDEDGSDLETLYSTEGASAKMDSTATQPQQKLDNAVENADLESVDFSWLRDYFS